MDNSHIRAWREHLVNQMVEQYNYKPLEARDLVDQWLDTVTRRYGRDDQDATGSLKPFRKRSSRTATAA